MITVYKILTYLLVPVGLLFALTTTLLFAAAIQNPQLLLGLFMIACTGIYLLVSFYVVVAGINQNKQVGATAKKWLIANGIVTAVYTAIMFFTCVSLAGSQANMDNFISMFVDTIKQPETITQAEILQILKTSINIAMVLALILLIHTILSFRMLKTYPDLFE